jgi:hypothetical protein
MRATSFGGHGHRTERTGCAQDRQRRSQLCRDEIIHAQLDLFGSPTSSDPLLGLAVKLPNACRCGDSVSTVGPGKPPHSASVRCRSCGLHRGWVSRANCTFINDVINTGGAPREPLVLRTLALKPEPNDDGISVVQHE